MPRWTQDDDEQFLRRFLPKFVEVRGLPRVKNTAKRAFIADVFEQYKSEFPGRMDTFNLTGNNLGLGGTAEERAKSMRTVSQLLLAVNRLTYHQIN